MAKTKECFAAFWHGVRGSREFLDAGSLRAASLGRRAFGVDFDGRTFFCCTLNSMENGAVHAQLAEARKCRLEGNYVEAWQALYSAREFRLFLRARLK